MPNIGFGSLADRFLEHKAVHLKPASLRCYRESAAMLKAAFGERKAATLTHEQVDRFIRGELGRGRTPGAVNVRLRILKAILRYGRIEGHLRDLPLHVKLLRVPKRKNVQVFTRDQMERLLSLAGPRERMLFLVLGSTGMRIDEALHLRWSDVDPASLRIRITAKPDVGWSPKSHAEREVYVSEYVMKELAEYRRRLVCRRDSHWVFQGRGHRGKRLTTCYKRTRELFEEAGLYEKGKLYHQLRRAAASTMLLNGVDLRTVQELLGHASVTTTQLYTFTNEDAKRAAAGKSLI
jgi:integrase